MDKITCLNMNSQFKKLYSKGKSAVRPTVVMYVKRNKLQCNRLGITVGKKIGKAVVRNRAKRRLRELYRMQSGTLSKGFDIVMVARVRTVTAPSSRLLSDFLSAASEVGVLKK